MPNGNKPDNAGSANDRRAGARYGDGHYGDGYGGDVRDIRDAGSKSGWL